MKTNVILIGLGILGCYSLLEILTKLALASKKDPLSITVMDFDKVEEINIGRQIFYSKKDIGKLKVEACRDFLQKEFLDFKDILERTELDFINARLDSKNISKYLNVADIVLDCTDNFQIRQIIDEFCFDNNKVWIYAGIERNRGAAATFDYRNFSQRSREKPKFQDLFKLGSVSKNQSGTQLAARGMAKIQIKKLGNYLNGKNSNEIEFVDFSTTKSQKFKVF